MKRFPSLEMTAAEQADILDSLDPEESYLEKAESTNDSMKDDSLFQELEVIRRKPRPKTL